MEDSELERILQDKARRITEQSFGKKEPTVRLTESNFQGYSSGNRPLFVDFWAEWCGPCKVMEPVLERLAQKYSGKIVFGKVNVDEEMNLSSQYQVLSIPTFMLFKNGNPVDAVIGAVGEAGLEQFLKRALNGSSIYS